MSSRKEDCIHCVNSPDPEGGCKKCDGRGWAYAGEVSDGKEIDPNDIEDQACPSCGDKVEFVHDIDNFCYTGICCGNVAVLVPTKWGVSLERSHDPIR